MRDSLLNSFAGIIDRLSVRPSQAYGMRRLTRRYTGPLIKVRRSSDSATLDIYGKADGLDVATLLAFVGSGSGFVNVAYSQTGGANMTQATTTKQPRIVNASVLDTFAGKPRMILDGTDDYLQTAVDAVSLGGTTLTLASVYSSTSPASYPRPLSFVGTLRPVDYDSVLSASVAQTTSTMAAGRNSVNSGGLTTVNAKMYSVLGIWDGTNERCFLNNVGDTQVGATGTFGSVGTLGVSIDNSTASIGGAFNGSWSEALFFTSALAESDRFVLYKDQQRFYGL